VTTAPSLATDRHRPGGAHRASAGRRGLPRHLLPILLLDVAAPFAAYQVLTGHGVSELTALAVGALFPLAGLVVAAVRARRLDAVAVITLTGSLVGLVGGLLLHSAQFLLVKDSIVTAGVGLAFLGSVWVGRPLTHLFARQMASDAAGRDRVERLWTTEPGYRSLVARMAVVWGIGLVLEACVRVGLSFAVPPAVLLVLSPVLAAVTFGGLGLWSHRRRAAARRTLPA
jgi:intracellular septation protein A